MKNSKLILLSLLNSIGVALYVSLIAWVLYNGERFFGNSPSMLTMAAILLLFVLSAAIVGALVLGRPAILYVNGLKSSAIKLFFYTVAWLVLITFAILIFQAFK